MVIVGSMLLQHWPTYLELLPIIRLPLHVLKLRLRWVYLMLALERNLHLLRRLALIPNL